MTTSDVIKRICDEQDISMTELAKRIGQSRQNLYNKMKRGTLSEEEIHQIAAALGVQFEQSFILPSGEQIKIDQVEKCDQ